MSAGWSTGAGAAGAAPWGEEGAQRKAPLWSCQESDAVSLLGAYRSWLARGGDEGAALNLRLVPKTMREAHQLQAQLRDTLRQIFPGDEQLAQISRDANAAPVAGPTAAPPAAPPGSAASASSVTAGQPNGAECLALRRALTFSLPDRVARLASLCDSPAEQALVLELGRDMKPALLRRAYFAAEQGRGRLLWLRPGSRIATMKPRPPYVCFFEIVETLKRPYMERASALDPAWLPDASPSLAKLGPPIRSLAPLYEKATDRTLCWLQPTYAAAGWQLPPVPRPPPIADTKLRASLFGRALCEGNVLKAVRPLAPDLAVRARGLTNDDSVDRAVLALRFCLESGCVFSRASLAARWREEPRFLLRELAALLPPAQRQRLLDAWPKMLLQAERV